VNANMAASIDQPVPVTVLTGFLGAGKTTLLGSLLEQPEMSATAVIINEFGEVGLDDLLVQTPQEKPVLLKNGCLCCTVRGDLAITLQDLFLQRAQDRYAFNRVMIETTGLADPAPILHILMTDPGICDHYRLEGIVTVVDCVNGFATLDAHPEAAKQAAVADRLLLTKQDIADTDGISRLRARLSDLNSGAVTVDATLGKIAASDVLGLSLYDPGAKSLDVQKWLRAEAYSEAYDHSHCAEDSCDHASHHHDVPNRHRDQIRSCCLTRDRPITWLAFSAWMERLVERRSAELLRVKGIVNIAECPGEPLVIHGVQHVFHPPVRMTAWPSGDHRTRIVLIARDWDESAIAAEFAKLD
jgi:G3E family GTPase